MMRSALSREGRAALRRALSGKPLLVFDLDGTLAPILHHDRAVRLRPRTTALLTALQRHAPVVVLTGRHIANAAEILRWRPTLLIGNHGSEGLPGTARELPRIECDCRRLIVEVAALAARHCPAGSWRIEDKRYTFTFHCSSARVRAAFIALLRRRAGTLRCTVIRAKRSCNVLPASAYSKGDAIGVLLAHFRATHAVFVGDDETDETVFALRDPRIVGIHVGTRMSRARFSLRRQRSVDTLLALLLRERERLAR